MAQAHLGFALPFGLPLGGAGFLLRVKGVLDVVGESQPLVIHGVHRTFHPPTLLARWPDADRRSQLVFITRDLDRASVEASWIEMKDV